MKHNKEKTKQWLLYLLIFLVGFAAGSTVAFIKLINMLKEYNMNINDFL